MSIQIAWRGRKFFEEPGIFLIIDKTRVICLIPFPKGR
jgi:hypothetical protein